MSTEIYIAPNIFAFISSNREKFKPFGYDIRPGRVIEPLPPKENNYRTLDLPDIDWVFIITYLFSLYTILFSYNAVSGEKEQGTLKLLLSNSISRREFLIGKYISVMILISIPLIFGLLINMTILTVSVPNFPIDKALIKFAFIIASTYLFVSVIAFLSLLFSSLIYDSSLVILSLLFIWIGLMIIPHISDMISKRVTKIPSEVEIKELKKHTIIDFENDVEKKYQNEDSSDYKGPFPSNEAAGKEIYPLVYKTHEKLLSIDTSYGNIIKKKNRISRNISRISPMVLFKNLASNFAFTGFIMDEKIRKDIESYSLIYDNYIKEKIGELAIITNTNITPWVLFEKMFDNKKFVYQGAVRPPMPVEYTGDKSDFPQPLDNNYKLSKVLFYSLIDFFVLILWHVILIISLNKAIDTADVR